MPFERRYTEILSERFAEEPRFIIVVAGPRQIGKTTVVRQALRNQQSTFVATDQPLLTRDDRFAETSTLPGATPTAEWLVLQWNQARVRAKQLPKDVRYVLAIDEIQKIPRWSEIVKGLWDEDRNTDLNMHVVLLGSSPWLMQQGLTESLAGRYELIRMSHWSYPEMQEAFDFSLEQYIYFGGYPGSANLINEESRWRAYVRDALIFPNIDKDLLQMVRVDKPALLKTLFELSCNYSGQIISLTKLEGQLGGGHTATLAHHLQLLSQAGFVTGIQKYSGQMHRARASIPKLNVHNTALMSAIAGYTFDEARADRSYWGRLVESAVGAHLINTASEDDQVRYWREGGDEVDFVLENSRNLLAIEVKSAPNFSVPKGLGVFVNAYSNAQPIIIGEGGMSLVDALSSPASDWQS